MGCLSPSTSPMVDVDAHVIGTRFLGPTRVHNRNGISIASTIFECDRPTGRPTDRQTDYATRSLTVGRIYLRSTAIRPNSTNTNDNVSGAVVMARSLESSPGSFDVCKLSARWPSTLRQSQPTWPASPPVGCYHPHSPSPFISITQLES